MSSDPRRLAALIETQTSLAATGLDTRALLTAVASHVRELTGADASFVELADHTGTVTRGAADSAVVSVGVQLDHESLAGQAFHQDQLVAWKSDNHHVTCVPDASSGPSTRAAIAAPLRGERKAIGVITVVSGRDDAFTEADEDTVRRICQFAAHQMLQVERLEQAERTSRRDPLTGLGNRRAFDETLAGEVARNGRYGRGLSVCTLDIDGFKHINDSFGHQAGDRVLMRVAQHLSAIRGADSAFRLGGDEFALILPETGSGEAELVARRVARRIREDTLADEVSVSWGVVEADHRDPRELLALADERLYARKRGEQSPPAASAEAS